jgi:type I restriction enzyme, S subunit
MPNSSVNKTTERFLNDVLLPMIGSIGNPVVVDTDRPFSIKNVAVFKYYDRNLADCGYLCLFLQHATARMRQLAAGGLQPFVSLTFLRGYPLLLPPLAEQRRIVIKAGELMVLCDQLEEAHGQQTLRKRSLTVAVHRQLKETDEKLLASASFLVEHLPRLTATREQIQHLRQTILTLAIRGKLVPQSPNDTCAGDTLGHRVLHSPLTEKSPWTLPAGWKWTSLGLIGETLGGGTPAKANLDYWSGPIPWVSPKDMKVHYISDAEDHISEAAVESSAAKLIPPGSVLVVVRGMILAHSFPAAISMVPLAINQDMKAIVPFRPDISPMLLLAMRALKPNVIQMVQRSTHGTCKLLTEDLLSLPIPFPPLEEQSRIVEKVDELIRMCDELDVLLDSSRVRRSRLLDSVLDHSLRDDALSQHSLLALGATDTPTIIRSIACQSPSP